MSSQPRHTIGAQEIPEEEPFPVPDSQCDWTFLFCYWAPSVVVSEIQGLSHSFIHSPHMCQSQLCALPGHHSGTTKMAVTCTLGKERTCWAFFGQPLECAMGQSPRLTQSQRWGQDGPRAVGQPFPEIGWHRLFPGSREQTPEKSVRESHHPTLQCLGNHIWPRLHTENVLMRKAFLIWSWHKQDPIMMSEQACPKMWPYFDSNTLSIINQTCLLFLPRGHLQRRGSHRWCLSRGTKPLSWPLCSSLPHAQHHLRMSLVMP